MDEQLPNLAANTSMFLQGPSLAATHWHLLLGILTQPHIIA